MVNQCSFHLLAETLFFGALTCCRGSSNTLKSHAMSHMLRPLERPLMDASVDNLREDPRRKSASIARHIDDDTF